jgi:hypothetical protein
VPAFLKAGCGALAVLLLILTYRYGGIRYFEPLGVPTASRALNQFTVVVMTCIALIIPLTSNLYTPKLVKVYVTHPLILSLGRHNEKAAVEILLTWAGPLWQEGIEPGSPVKKAAWRSLIRAHWEARAAGLGDLADALLWRYLSDPTIHREQVELLLDENRELHFEFNDRLMRFAHFSPGAEELARAFTEEW